VRPRPGLVGSLALALAAAIGASAAAESSRSPDELTQALVALNARFQAAAAAERGRLLPELLRLAAEREKALAFIVEREPGAVLRLALPRDVRASLPSSVRAQVEEEVELEGEVEVLHEDRASGSRYLYFLEAAGERYSLHFAREAPALVTGTRVRVKGVRIGHALVL